MTVPPDPGAVRRIWLLAACGAALWLAGIFLAPLLAGRGAGGTARLVYAVYAPVCHQIPGRSFRLLGQPLAVCGRCLGIYAGFAAGLILYALARGFRRPPVLPPARLFLLLTLPLAVDGLGGLLRLWRSPIGLRFATGFVWGGLLPWYALAGLADLVRARRERAAARALEKPGPKK